MPDLSGNIVYLPRQLEDSEEAEYLTFVIPITDLQKVPDIMDKLQVTAELAATIALKAAHYGSEAAQDGIREAFAAFVRLIT